MGRDRKNERAREHFTQMFRHTMESPAWRALSTTAQALYPWIKLEWTGPNANNNGRIALSVRQAADRLSVRPDTASKAFHDLQAKGFIVLTEFGTLGSTGEAKCHLYEVTELPLPPNERTGRKLFLQWSQGQDFSVPKMRPNNPNGRNGKTESRHENRDEPVPKTVTNFRSLSRKP